MPPKKQGASKKTEAKKKEKLIEDKTFGLKNKKGSKQQKFIDDMRERQLFSEHKAKRNSLTNEAALFDDPMSRNL